MARRRRRAARGERTQVRRVVDVEVGAELDTAEAGPLRVDSTPVAEGDPIDPWAGRPSMDRVLHTPAAAHNRGLLDAGIDDATDAEVEAIEAAQDAADRAFQAETEAEVAEADALYGPYPHESRGQVVPGPEQFDGPWRTPGPPVPGLDLAAAELDQPGTSEAVEQVGSWLVHRAADVEAAEVDRDRRDHAEYDHPSLEPDLHADEREGGGPSLGPHS